MMTPEDAGRALARPCRLWELVADTLSPAESTVFGPGWRPDPLRTAESGCSRFAHKQLQSLDRTVASAGLEISAISFEGKTVLQELRTQGSRLFPEDLSTTMARRSQRPQRVSGIA